jgi:hypothetical protein
VIVGEWVGGRRGDIGVRDHQRREALDVVGHRLEP